MKKITLLLLTVAVCFFSACSKAQKQSEEKTDMLKDKKILIVYLSRTKNTRAIAEIIHRKLDSDTLVALELEQPYPENYQATVAQVARENETGYLPPLKTKIHSISSYDVIFIGFPTWGMQLPPPMKSFLHQYNLAEKTVIPFNTNGGYGIGSSFDTVKELCPDSKILEGFTMRGGSERDGKLLVITGDNAVTAEAAVQKWLQQIGLLKNN
jgi:flavodoxin